MLFAMLLLANSVNSDCLNRQKYIKKSVRHLPLVKPR